MMLYILATIGDVVVVLTTGMAISLILFYWRGETHL